MKCSSHWPQKLKEDNDVLSQRLQAVEAEFIKKREELEENERKLKDEIKQLEAESQASAREVRNLGAKLTALQAKSPDVSDIQNFPFLWYQSFILNKINPVSGEDRKT